MKTGLKKLLKAVIFLAIGVAIFFGVQDILILNDITGGTPGVVMDGFFDMEEPIDVLLIGNSHIQEGFSPMQLYKNTELVSYDLSCSVQPIECSYYLLKEAFTRQKPRIVIFDPISLFYQNINLNIAWRYVLDHLPLDTVRLEMAEDYDDEWFSDGGLSGILPIIKYHTRWSELGEKDFVKSDALRYAAGEIPVAISTSTALTMDGVESLINQMKARSDGYATTYDGKATDTIELNDDLYSSEIMDSKLEYLMKMKKLCDDNGAKLILITIPTVKSPIGNVSFWSSDQSQIMKEVSTNLDLTYIDLACDYDIVDWNTDSFDGGNHLNIKGAEKATKFISDYLLTVIDRPEEKSKLYDRYLKKYETVYDLAMLQMEMDFYGYVEKLSERKSDYIVCISVCSDYTKGMTQSDIDFVSSKLGLNLFSEGGYCDAYAAVIDGGNVLYEEVSNRKISHELDIANTTVNLYSSGYFTVPGASISINGVPCATGGSGLNFVIWDKTIHLVVDSVSFETYQPSKPATRNWTLVNKYLRTYESQVCFD